MFLSEHAKELWIDIVEQIEILGFTPQVLNPTRFPECPIKADLEFMWNNFDGNIIDKETGTQFGLLMWDANWDESYGAFLNFVEDFIPFGDDADGQPGRVATEETRWCVEELFSEILFALRKSSRTSYLYDGKAVVNLILPEFEIEFGWIFFTGVRESTRRILHDVPPPVPPDSSSFEMAFLEWRDPNWRTTPRRF